MNLRAIDLNLLPVFEAIYVERSLTRASQALNITQPAVSNALARLRAALGDPLFVRAQRGMAPTPAAEALIGPVRDALARLRSGLDQRAAFDPSTSERVFNVSMGEMLMAQAAPALAQRLETTAPGVRFHFQQVERDKLARDLTGGALDCAIDIATFTRPELDSKPLADSDRYVCVFRRDHPALRGKLTLQRYLGLRHVVVSSRRAGRTMVDVGLAALGERVRPVLRLTLWGPAFDVAMVTDCVLVAPASVARRYDVAVRELPFEAPALGLRLYWPRAARHDPANVWAREEIMHALNASQR